MAEACQAAWRSKRVRLRLLTGRRVGSRMEHAWLRAAHSGALHSHQRDGIRWLYRRSGCGGILGDDPGLGKSLQAIALVHALVAARQVRRVLVVAPANLVKNWQLELVRWSAKVAPKLTVAYAGAGESGLHDELKFRQLVQTRDDAHLVLVTSRLSFVPCRPSVLMMTRWRRSRKSEA